MLIIIILLLLFLRRRRQRKRVPLSLDGISPFASQYAAKEIERGNGYRNTTITTPRTGTTIYQQYDDDTRSSALDYYYGRAQSISDGSVTKLPDVQAVPPSTRALVHEDSGRRFRPNYEEEMIEEIPPDYSPN